MHVDNLHLCETTSYLFVILYYFTDVDNRYMEQIQNLRSNHKPSHCGHLRTLTSGHNCSCRLAPMH